MSDCSIGRRDPTRSIAACTLIINNSRDISALLAAYYGRGTALARTNDLVHALQDLDKAVTLGGRLAYILEDRAEVRLSLGSFSSAVEDFSAAIRIDPKHAFRFHGRARAFQGMGDNDSALRDFDTAISLDPRDFRFFDRGVLHSARHEFGRAVADFDETIRLNPSFAEAYAKRGLALVELGQKDRAVADADRSLELDSKDPANYTTRALVLERLGNLPGARADLEASLSRRPEDRETLSAYDRVKLAIAARHATAEQVLSPNGVADRGTGVASAPARLAPNPLRRVALVIGNGAYAQVGALSNTVFDAKAVSQMFNSEGFDRVELKADLNLNALRRALADFELASRGADIAVVYFSGHGIESGGKNFLVPIDAKLEREVDIEDETVPLDRVLRAVSDTRQLKLVILDACRNDPFKAVMQRANGSRAVERGLARVEPESRTLVAYSAAAGTVAQDGEPGGHSPFTLALLKDLAIPNLDVRLALGKVHDDVLSITGGAQEPFVYGSLGGAETALVSTR